MPTTYIPNSAYSTVLSRVAVVKHTLWIGKYCKACKRREFCADPIA